MVASYGSGAVARRTAGGTALEQSKKDEKIWAWDYIDTNGLGFVF
jgi:hypothetical protein